MKIAVAFVDGTAGRDPLRVSFQFAVTGTEQTGVVYVTMDVKRNALATAPAAARKAAKRAGCPFETVVLHRIMAPRS